MQNASNHKRKSKLLKFQLTNGSSQLLNSSLKEKLRLKDEREMLVLWKSPLQTLLYFFLECSHLLRQFGQRLWDHKLLAVLVSTIVVLLYSTTLIPGPHQPILEILYQQLLWYNWWLWLGVLSSVGLGTGLHTFLFYLGPFIAKVTMAAYSCNSVDFPSPPYPDEIVCPAEGSSIPVNIFRIMSKVRLEAFMWGVGTALGELPPYFMARGARLSGHDTDDEELQGFEELQKLEKENPSDLSVIDKMKLSIEHLVQRVGFFGILLCASIPNPLFDLAGITCGHFLIPFWTFFGATVIGKAVFKMHIQKLFVIFTFSESLLERAFDLVALVPIFGPKLQGPLKDFLDKQKLKFKKDPPPGGTKEGGNVIAWIFEKFIILMICYFLLSIVNSLAQSYHKRVHKNKVKNTKAKE